MLSVKEASKALSVEFERHFREGSPESDQDLNSASRQVIRAMKRENGEVWLLDVNKGTCGIWNGGYLLRNFCASHALPVRDAQLMELVHARLKAPYEGVKKDALRLERIAQRVVEVGGEVLLWS